MQNSESQGQRSLFLALVFVLYGLVATALLALLMPPFQNPDEPNHFLRAAQLAEGGLVGHWLPGVPADAIQRQAGGVLDPALMNAFVPFIAVASHPQTRATREMWAPDVHWSAQRAPMAFSNTAVYPPFFYVPSALGVRIGRAAGLSVVRTLTLSRLLNGVASVAVGGLAIGLGEAGGVWLFAILTLPMSFALMASPAQDGLLLACGALVAALLPRAMRARHGEGLALLTAMLALVVIARPPYLGLALLPLALGGVAWRWRLLSLASVVAAAAAWSAIVAATALTNIGGFLGADPAAQTALLLHHPWRVVLVTWHTLALQWRFYAESFVGNLGWLDTVLPPVEHAAALAVLAVAALAVLLAPREGRVGVAGRLPVAAGILAAFVAIFMAEYLAWTVPGQATVDGVQGRYFLPLALVAVALLPALGSPRLARTRDALVLGVALFPVVTIGVTVHAVVLRYYLG